MTGDACCAAGIAEGETQLTENRFLAEMDDLYAAYRQELEEAARKHKPASGLFGVGHSIKDDACHERFDEAVRKFAERAAGEAASGEALQIIRRLYTEADGNEYPLSAKWMMIAAERHILLLVPALTSADAAVLSAEYGKKYRPWNRLPAQREVFAALKKRAKEQG